VKINQEKTRRLKSINTPEVKELQKKYRGYAHDELVNMLVKLKVESESRTNELITDLESILKQFLFEYNMQLEYGEDASIETNDAYIRGKKKGVEIALETLKGICHRLAIDRPKNINSQ